MSMDDDDKPRGILSVLFSKPLSEIPCFRNSYLYGISGGIGSGLAYFMFTSRPRRSCNFAVASFAVITMSYWTYCRYHFEKNQEEAQKLKILMQEQSREKSRIFTEPPQSA